MKEINEKLKFLADVTVQQRKPQPVSSPANSRGKSPERIRSETDRKSIADMQERLGLFKKVEKLQDTIAELKEKAEEARQ